MVGGVFEVLGGVSGLMRNGLKEFLERVGSWEEFLELRHLEKKTVKMTYWQIKFQKLQLLVSNN